MPRKPTPYDKPKNAKKQLIPLPPATDTHTPVRKKDGSYYWRTHRGTITPATLNPVLTAMAKHTKRSMAAAKQFIVALNPFTCNRMEGFRYDAYSRNAQRLAARLTKSIMTDGKMGWSFFEDFDLNPNCTLDKIFGIAPPLFIKKDIASVKFQLHDNMVSKLRNYQATHFYFELILISGDPAKVNGLRSENDLSPDYPYTSHEHFKAGNKKPYCELSVQLPEKKPFIVIFKAATRDGRFSSGPLHEGLKVIAWE